MTIPITADRIMRLPEVLATYGKSRATLYAEAKRGVFPPPIPLGGRLSGWLQSEIYSLIRARVSQQSEDEIRQLVRELVLARRSAA